MSSSAIFVTGTDTDVGKTWVTTRLITLLRIRGVDAVGMKPIECGSHDDSKAIYQVSEPFGPTLDEVNPIHLDEPLAPMAVSEPLAIDFAKLKAGADSLCERWGFLLVEGAGGWLVPIDKERMVADLAVEFGFPVLVVASNRLGVLNHTLLTVKAIEDAGLRCMGVFLNTFEKKDLSQESNAAILRETLNGIPVFDQDLDLCADACMDL